MGLLMVLTLPACGGGGGDEDVDEQVAVVPGDNFSPAPPAPPAPGGGVGGDTDGSGSGTCSASGRPDATRRALSETERRALVASCNGAGAGLIDIDLNFLTPPPVPASGVKK